MSINENITSVVIGQQAQQSTQPNVVHFELSNDAVKWPNNVWVGPPSTTLEQNQARISAEVEAEIARVLKGKTAGDIIEHIFTDVAGKRWRIREPSPEPILFAPGDKLQGTTCNWIVDMHLKNILRAADSLAETMARPTLTAGAVKMLMKGVANDLDYLALMCEDAAKEFRALK